MRSETAKRFRVWHEAEDKKVVLAADYDKLANVVRELCLNYESIHDDSKHHCPGRPMCKWLNQIDNALSLIAGLKEGV